mgnify:CR=1 FL=1
MADGAGGGRDDWQAETDGSKPECNGACGVAAARWPEDVELGLCICVFHEGLCLAMCVLGLQDVAGSYGRVGGYCGQCVCVSCELLDVGSRR